MDGYPQIIQLSWPFWIYSDVDEWDTKRIHTLGDSDSGKPTDDFENKYDKVRLRPGSGKLFDLISTVLTLYWDDSTEISVDQTFEGQILPSRDIAQY